MKKKLKLDLRKYNTGDLFLDMDKGTYVLTLFLKRDKDIIVGRGGGSSLIPFRAGYYAYVGSAHGLKG